MSFNAWLYGQTGLTVYDYFALVWGEFTLDRNIEELNKKFDEWIVLRKPSEEDIQKAKDLISNSGRII